MPNPKTRIPTVEEWVAKHLETAPERSEQWLCDVAAIYGIDLGDDRPPYRPVPRPACS